jgi:uncharacterized membrane protein
MDKALLFKISFLVFCLGIAANVFAIGMITEPIVIENILRGGEISKTVTVFNPEGSEVVYTLGTEGGIKGWAEFFEIGKLDTPVTKVNVPAKTYYDVIAKIKVPDGTPNGEYTGEIFVKLEPKEQPNEGENTVSVAQMISREVRIKVTDQEVIKLDTTLIPETYDVKQGQSLKIKIIYENLGNISLKPNLQLKITSTSDEKAVFNAIFPYPETEDAVKPGETKTMPIFEWQTTGQPKGRYGVEVTTLIGSEVSEKNDFHFNIGDVSLGGELGSKEDSSLTKNKFLAAVSLIGGGNLILGWIVIGGLLLLLTFVLILIKRKFALDARLRGKL